jgi:hypothetical protein
VRGSSQGTGEIPTTAAYTIGIDHWSSFRTVRPFFSQSGALPGGGSSLSLSVSRMQPLGARRGLKLPLLGVWRARCYLPTWRGDFDSERLGVRIIGGSSITVRRCLKSVSSDPIGFGGKDTAVEMGRIISLYHSCPTCIWGRRRYKML